MKAGTHSRKPTPEEFRAIKKARQDAERKQLEGIESSEIFKLTVESKLITAGACGPRFENFKRCGRDTIFIGCYGCGKTSARFYQCNCRWCPRCNWRITERRKRILEKITAGMTNVKHVVLTQRNFVELTREKILESNERLLKLRRRRITGRVFGGCASTEFTNEDAGWHLHFHLLLHTKFICANCLAFEWGQLVGQEFAIVKVIPVDDTSYLKEVCKYVVTGSELASWTPTEIWQFVQALEGTKLFRVFGTFAQVRKYAQAQLDQEKPEPIPCECGCKLKFAATSEEEATRIFMAQYK